MSTCVAARPLSLPRLRKFDDEHKQADELLHFFDKFKEYQRTNQNVPLKSCNKTLTAALSIAQSIITHFRERERELIDSINSSKERVREIGKTIDNSFDILRGDSLQLQTALWCAFLPADLFSCSSFGPRTWAQRVAQADPSCPSTFYNTPDSSVTASSNESDNEIVVNMTCAGRTQHSREDETQGTLHAINDALVMASQRQPALGGIYVDTVQNLCNSDIKILGLSGRNYELLKRHDAWVKLLDPTAHLAPDLFQVVIRQVHIEDVGLIFGPQSISEIGQLLAVSNERAFEFGGRVQSVAWLSKRQGVGTLVVGFDKALTANQLIADGTIYNQTRHKTEKYHSSHRVLQCTNCQLYGHTALDCHTDSPICGYCAQSHSTSVCREKRKHGFKPTCTLCDGVHFAWSQRCRSRSRQAEIQRAVYARGRGRQRLYHVVPLAEQMTQETASDFQYYYNSG